MWTYIERGLEEEDAEEEEEDDSRAFAPERAAKGEGISIKTKLASAVNISSGGTLPLSTLSELGSRVIIAGWRMRDTLRHRLLVFSSSCPGASRYDQRATSPLCTF